MQAMRALLIFALITVCTADIQKLANGVIRNGTHTYGFATAKPGFFSLVQRNEIPYTDDVLICMHPFHPFWADVGGGHDSTPDINVINENDVRLYFSALHVNKGVVAIGVASSNEIWPDASDAEDDGFFKTPANPLLIAEPGQDLLHPSLVQSPEGLTLFYYNSTGQDWEDLGIVMAIGLTDDGLKVNGTSNGVLEASLDWEGSRIKSPQVFTHDGMIYIMYTSADEDSIGVARSNDPMGPFEKKLQPMGRISHGVKSPKGIQMNELRWEGGWPVLVN